MYTTGYCIPDVYKKGVHCAKFNLFTSTIYPFTYSTSLLQIKIK